MAMFIKNATDYRTFRAINLRNVAIAKEVGALCSVAHYRNRLVQIRSEYYKGVAI